MYGKITIEQAQQLATQRKDGAVELFKVGDAVSWKGANGVISDIDAYGEDAGLWWNWSHYYVQWPNGRKQLVDFTDAHFTCGGTLKLVA